MIELTCPCGHRWKVKVNFGPPQQLCTACILYRRIERYEWLAIKLRTKRRAILDRRAAAKLKESP